MTFKGASYETIIDIERLILIEEARLKMYKVQYKTFKMQNFSESASEAMTVSLMQEKMIAELKKLREGLMEDLQSTEYMLGEIEYRVFLYKFVYGYSNAQIMEKLNITLTPLYAIYENISDLLEITEYGKRIKDTLAIDGNKSTLNNWFKCPTNYFKYKDDKLYPKDAKASKKA